LAANLVAALGKLEKPAPPKPPDDYVAGAAGIAITVGVFVTVDFFPPPVAIMPSIRSP
jgi:hypothetical protein